MRPRALTCDEGQRSGHHVTHAHRPKPSAVRFPSAFKPPRVAVRSLSACQPRVACLRTLHCPVNCTTAPPWTQHDHMLRVCASRRVYSSCHGRLKPCAPWCCARQRGPIAVPWPTVGSRARRLAGLDVGGPRAHDSSNEAGALSHLSRAHVVGVLFRTHCFGPAEPPVCALTLLH